MNAERLAAFMAPPSTTYPSINYFIACLSSDDKLYFETSPNFLISTYSEEFLLVLAFP